MNPKPMFFHLYYTAFQHITNLGKYWGENLLMFKTTIKCILTLLNQVHTGKTKEFSPTQQS